MENKLLKYGYNETISEDFFAFISMKHHSRFEPLIKWIRINGLPVNEFNITMLYKTDVVVRRMLSEILKPIELGIQAKLMTWIEENTITKEQLMGGKHYESLVELQEKVVANKIKTWSWMNNSMVKLNRDIGLKKPKNNNRVELYEIVSKFTFGQLSAIISLFPEELIKRIFNFIGSKKEYCLILEKIVELRNWIAHHSIIFNDKKFKIKWKEYQLKDIIESLSIVTWGNYREELKGKVIFYRNNIINKYYKENKEDTVKVMELFDAIISHLINV